jgi:hypothetical protein
LKDIQILEYLNSEEKVSGNCSSNLSKYMSDSVRSEINEFQNQLQFEREAQEYRKKNYHDDYQMKMADHEGTKAALFSNSEDPVV